MRAALSNPDIPVAAPTRVEAGWLNWAVYLGMSWTWCIGMFLPYLMVRDFGILAWFVFAIPNVVGAAAMGWVLRSAESSERIVRSHALACRLFSAVTIAFHLFFVIAVVQPLSQNTGIREKQALDLTLGGTIAACVLLYIYMTRRSDGGRVLAWIVFAISLCAMILATSEIFTIGHPLSVKTGANGAGLASLAPVCIFGFLACPYLDLTFHRARQHSNRPRASFGWGFGFFFLLMIVFTLIYALALIPKGGMNSFIAILVFVHVGIQTAFTITAHARELQHGGEKAAALAAGLTLLAWGIHWTLPDSRLYHGLEGGEIIYRVFMGFYGLVFPAYVWLVMLPFKGHAPSRRSIIVCILAVLVAMPMFWMGFIAQQMIWLLPGLGVVLLARLLIPTPAMPAPIPHATV